MPKKTTRSAKMKKSTKKSDSKAISINEETFKALERRKLEIEATLGGRATYSIVIRSLLNDHIDLENIRQEMEQIKEEAETTQEFIKEVLKLAVTSPASPAAIISPVFPQNTGFINPPPPSPPSLSPPPPPTPQSPPKNNPNGSNPQHSQTITTIKTNYKPPNTANLRSDYQKEIKQVFNGEILKPSEVLNLTQPKHKNAEIKELKEDAPIPEVENISFVHKNAAHFAEKPKDEPMPPNHLHQEVNPSNSMDSDSSSDEKDKP